MFDKYPEADETPLTLGEYISIHASRFKPNPLNCAEPCDLKVHREELFLRIQKQKGEDFRRLEKTGGTLIDPRRRTVA